MKHPLYKTIKGKFLIIVTTLILILSVGIIWFCYSFFYRSLQNSAIHSIESNLQFMADKINSQLSDIYAFTKFCQNNSDIVKFVTTGRESDNYASVTSKAKARLDEEYLINPANRNSSSPYIQRVVVANLNRRDYLQYVNSAYSIDKSMVDMIRGATLF